MLPTRPLLLRLGVLAALVGAGTVADVGLANIQVLLVPDLQPSTAHPGSSADPWESQLYADLARELSSLPLQ